MRSKAFVFDLGDTLIEYEGLPLSWEAHYSDALNCLAASLGISLTAPQLAAGHAVLRKYNTRHSPRDREVTFAVILENLLVSWDVCLAGHDEIQCAATFFQIFRQRLRCFPETKAVLQSLRQRGVAIGIFTDVPYGMPRDFVLADIKATALDGLFDVLLTSREVGYRKPRIETIAAVAAALNCDAPQITHVGNERKDIDVALAFGCRSVLINRSEQKFDWGQERTISSLLELVPEN